MIGKQMKSLLFVILVITGLTGCSQLKDTSADHPTEDTSWLIHGLEDRGIAIEGGGTASLRVSAESSMRMVLNQNELVDVYEFEDADAAMQEAQVLLGASPNREVYVKDKLVVVHHKRAGSGLSAVLNELLGRTI